MNYQKIVLNMRFKLKEDLDQYFWHLIKDLVFLYFQAQLLYLIRLYLKNIKLNFIQNIKYLNFISFFDMKFHLKAKFKI